MKKEIPQSVLGYLNQRFTLVDHLSFLEFDFDFDILKNRLKTIYKDVYDQNDRILIEHMDTDYYFQGCNIGINLRNFFLVVKDLNISYSVFVFYTNHIGIKKEIDILCRDAHIEDRPLIIESFLSDLHHKKDYIKPIETDFRNIQYHALCMMHLTRSHRNAIFHALNDIDHTKLLLSATIPSNNARI
jgi:hypothetical protein